VHAYCADHRKAVANRWPDDTIRCRRMPDQTTKNNTNAGIRLLVAYAIMLDPIRPVIQLIT
jgi:hypothetical protein